jgi:hypothetical protein
VSSIATRPVARVNRVAIMAAVAALAAIVTVLALVLSSGGSSGSVTSVQQPPAQRQYIGQHGEYRAPRLRNVAPTTAEALGQRPGHRP